MCCGGGVKLLVSIGYTRCNTYQEQAIRRLMDEGYILTNFIAPGSNCWPGSIEPESGVLIFDNAFIGVGCCLMKGVIISEESVLSHNVTVDPFVFFSDGVVVGGHARIGRNSFVGLNSTIKSGCKIGSYNIIGSGANVLHDTEDNCVVKGNPGRAEVKETLEISI